MNLAPRCQSIADQTLPDFRTEFHRCWTTASQVRGASAVDGRVGFGPFEAEKSGGLGDCQAVRQSRHWPPALTALVGRGGGKPAGRDLLSGASLAAGSCLRAADRGGRLAAGGGEVSEDSSRPSDTRATTVGPRHPLRNRQNFLQPPQPTLLLFGRSYIKVYTLFQFS